MNKGLTYEELERKVGILEKQNLENKRLAKELLKAKTDLKAANIDEVVKSRIYHEEHEEHEEKQNKLK